METTLQNANPIIYDVSQDDYIFQCDNFEYDDEESYEALTPKEIFGNVIANLIFVSKLFVKLSKIHLSIRAHTPRK